MASEGKNHRKIARNLDINRQMARLWRNRWLETEGQKLSVFQNLQDYKFIDYFNQTMAKPFKWTYKGKVLAI